MKFCVNNSLDIIQKFWFKEGEKKYNENNLKCFFGIDPTAWMEYKKF